MTPGSSENKGRSARVWKNDRKVRLMVGDYFSPRGSGIRWGTAREKLPPAIRRRGTFPGANAEYSRLAKARQPAPPQLSDKSEGSDALAHPESLATSTEPSPAR